MNTIITKADIKDKMPSVSPYEVLNDYCSEDILRLLKDLGVIHIFEKGCQYGKPPFITHQIVMKWLREKGIIINIEYKIFDGIYAFYIIYQSDEGPTMLDFKERFKTYEETVDAALMYCLTNLI